MKRFNKPILIIGTLISVTVLIFFAVNGKNLEDTLLESNAIISGFDGGFNSNVSNYIKHSKLKQETEEKIEKSKILPIVSISLFGATLLISFFANGFIRIVDNVDTKKDVDAFDELKKLKLLFEEGIITTEEYESKRKNMLDKM